MTVPDALPAREIPFGDLFWLIVVSVSVVVGGTAYYILQQMKDAD